MIKVAFDVILINLAFVLAYFFRFELLFFINPGAVIVLSRYLNVLVFVTVVWLAIFQLVGLYDRRRYPVLFDELAVLTGAVTLATLVLFGFLFLYRGFWFSRLVLLNAWWLSLLLLGSYRMLLFQLGRYLRRRGWGVKNLLIIGAGEVGQTLARKINLDPALGYRLVGFLDTDRQNWGKKIFGFPVFGGLSETAQLISEKNISEVIISADQLSQREILNIITESERLGVQFKLVPGILELIASRVDADEIAGVPLLTVSEIRLQGMNALIKRSVDLAGSGLGLLLLFPLFLTVAVLIKLSSPGPIFFRQPRVGLDGKIFQIFKFRSMIVGAEAQLPELEKLSEAEGHIFKIKNDPRITKLGRFLRRYSIDELPQLLNVFLGEMSLVGPRPPLPREVEKYDPWQKKRLRVRPGITGPWQVSGRSLLPFDEMVRLDIYYIENWSLWLDCKILLRTIPVVLTGSGAY